MPNALYTDSEFRNAGFYLNYRPIEPSVQGLRPIAIDAVPIFNSQISLMDIWGFLRFKASIFKEDLVIYSHGMVTASKKSTGLSLVIENKKNVELTKDVVELLNNDGNLKAEVRRSKLGLSKLEMQMIDNFLSEIQVCCVNHLAFRACNIGNDTEYMLMMAKLFNAKYVSSPMQRDFFSKVEFFRISVEDFAKLEAGLIKLPTFEEQAAKLAAAKGRKARAKVVQGGATFHGSGNDRLVLVTRATSATEFNAAGFATSARAVEQFYAAKYRCQVPVRFSDADFLGDASAEGPQPAHMVGRTMGLFGLSRGTGDVIKFPNDPEYANLIAVVKNESYIGDVPMYIAPLPSGDDLIELNLRQRLRMRLQGVAARLR